MSWMIGVAIVFIFQVTNLTMIVLTRTYRMRNTGKAAALSNAPSHYNPELEFESTYSVLDDEWTYKKDAALIDMVWTF